MSKRKTTLKEINTYRKDSMRIAKQLGYPQTAIRKIANAMTISQITRIMYSARLGEYEKKEA